MAKPDRRAENENIGGQHLLPNHRPVIPFAFIGSDAGFDVVIDHAQQLALRALLLQRGEGLLEQQVAGRVGGGGFQGAVQGKGGE